MATQVRETKAGRSIAAYVILKGAREIAHVHAYFADTGGVTVDVYQWGKSAERSAKAAALCGLADETELNHQQGRATGYGYDKFTAALSGLFIDGIRMADHCQTDAALDRLLGRYHAEIDASNGQCGLVTEQYEAKARRLGAMFASPTHTTLDGDRLVRTQVGVQTIAGVERPKYDTVKQSDLEAARDAGTFPEAYTGPSKAYYRSLYAEPGLKRLEMKGYTVILAI